MSNRLSLPLSRRRFLNSGVAGVIAFSLSPALPALAARNRLLLAGAGKRRVTPTLSVPYLTSSGNGTSARFQGVHDDLFARALVLDDGHTAIAILSVDAIGYDNSLLGPGRNFTRELRRKVAKQTGLKPGAIMLAATHAHSVPETIGLTSLRDAPGVPEWLERHLQALADTIVDAWHQRAPARAFAGITRVEGIARYRRILLKSGKLSVHGPLPPSEQVATPWQLDEHLNLLLFERDNGTPCAVLMNYTAHPVTAMLLPQVSADYPGAAATLVEQQLPGSVCLFTQGAAGNVNSLKVSSNFDDVAAFGGKLGQAALDKITELRRGQPLRETGLQTRSAEIVFEPRPCAPLTQAENVASVFSPTPNGATTRLAAKLAEGPLRGELQAMSLGPIRWLSLPGEAFVETGLALKAAGASFVVGYANGYLGYFPIRRAYAEGGYEVLPGAWSRVAPGSAEQLEAAGQNLLTCLDR